MKQLRAAIREVVPELPPRCRLAYILVEQEGQSVREAARQLNATEDTVYQLLRRAYSHLVRKLRERGFRQ